MKMFLYGVFTAIFTEIFLFLFLVYSAWKYDKEKDK